MEAVPAKIPDTIPDVPTVAVVGALLLQEPPGVPSVNEVVEPAHTLVIPETVEGEAWTVTASVAVHPAPSV